MGNKRAISVELMLQCGKFMPQLGKFMLQCANFVLQYGKFMPKDAKFMLKDGNFMLQCGNFVLKDAKMLIKCGILGHKLPIFDKKDDRIQRYQMEYGLNSMISDKNKTLITLLLK